MASRGHAVMDGVTERWSPAGVRLLEISDPHALTQAIGWLKFTGDARGQTLYRGHASFYDDLILSAFRGRGLDGRNSAAADLRHLIDAISGSVCRCGRRPKPWAHQHECHEVISKATHVSPAIVSGSYRAVLEPLLQNYGIATRWVDLVDNIWIALWFACVRQVAHGRYAFHQRRTIFAEGTNARAYITVIDTGPVEPTGIPGYEVGHNSRLVDLRKAVPSVYLRPHAQHGLLVAKAKAPDSDGGSLRSQIAAVLDISLGDALSWLGAGVMSDSLGLPRVWLTPDL